MSFLNRHKGYMTSRKSYNISIAPTIEEESELGATSKAPSPYPVLGPVSNLTPKLRVVVLGDAQVGKSSLVCRFLTGSFCDSYNPTVEDYYETTMVVDDGHQMSLEIVDTSGAYSFPAMRRLAITTGDTFLIVFSFEKMGTLSVATALRDEIYHIKGEGQSTIVFVANKWDVGVSQRDVNIRLAMELCMDKRQHRFIETSAKEDFNVHEVFREMAREYESQTRRIAFAVAIPTRGDEDLDVEKREDMDSGNLTLLPGCFKRFGKVDFMANQR